MKVTKVLSLLTIVALVCSVHLSAYMAGNESDSAYNGGGSGKSSLEKVSADTPTIAALIALGGGHLLQSGSHIDAFLSQIELSEISEPDYKRLDTTLNAAIYAMEKASAAYLQLKNLAGSTPYNQEVIDRLINFDYDLFMKENGLIPAIWGKVRGLLAVGDVTGVYKEFYLYTVQILDLLYTLKKDLYTEILPKLPTLWSINQKYGELKIFGQYVSQAFYSIK